MLSCSVCEIRGNLHLVLFETDEQGGDQFTSQEMTYHTARQIPGSTEVVDLKNLLYFVFFIITQFINIFKHDKT